MPACLLVGRDDNGAVRQVQAGARHRAHGRGLARLADRSGCSQDKHLGVCRAVEHCPWQLHGHDAGRVTRDAEAYSARSLASL